MARYKHSAARSSTNGGGGGFAAVELTNLLSTTSNTTNVSIGGEEEDGPVGAALANPTNILTFSTPDAALRNQLQPSLQLSAATNATANAGGGGFGGSSLFGSAPPATSYVPAAAPPTNNEKAINAYITLHNKKTALTPQIAKEALQLADELHLAEGEAIALYAMAMEVSQNEHNGGRSGIGNGSSGRSVDGEEFVSMLVRGGKVGYEKKDGQQQQQGMQQQGGLQQQQPPPQKTSTKLPSSPVVATAQRLFFQERSALLTTVLNLIKNRIEAADGITANAAAAAQGTTELVLHGNNTNGGGGSTSTSAMLEATNQLLKAGLVSNLIQTVRELTNKIGEIGATLKNVEHYQQQQNVARQQPQPAAAPASTAFGTGLFGSTPAAAPAPPMVGNATTNTTARTNYDMEYALLGFAHHQRQLASECLFYLAYHTQLTVEEVCAIIDLIKDLSNEGLPILDPLGKDVPSPYDETGGGNVVEGGGAMGHSGFGGGGMSPWMMQQQQQQQYSSQFYGYNATTPMNQATLKIKDAKVWENELVTSLWKRGQPQLLQCVSTLIMSVACAFDARHMLINRDTHGVNSFGVGNALFPPPQGVGANTTTTAALQQIHQRLDPNDSTVEASWKRDDIWGLLLVQYALLLKAAAPNQLMSPRGSPSSPAVGFGGGGGNIDVKKTFTKCLMVASQLKSLTFARLSLLPSFSSSQPHTATSSSSSTHLGESSSWDFYLSVLSELAAQYIDALGSTGNMPITRNEWLDEEEKISQSEWIEKEQKRQFGVWAGTEEENSEEDKEEGPRVVNIMDRPDCLEDVFALVSSVCGAYPQGARSFWEHTSAGLAPSRALKALDLHQAETGSSLFVYLSFLGALSLSEEGGADTVHSILCGENPVNVGAESRFHIGWNYVIESIRWYAESLSPEEETPSASSKQSTIRRSSSTTDTAVAEGSTSYYYGAGAGASAYSGADASSSSTEQSTQGRSTSSSNVTNTNPKTKELDEVGRNTLQALLCLLSNVASHSAAARNFVLDIKLPSTDGQGGAGMYQDGSLEILFSLLTIPTLPTDIMGLAFTAIANLLQPNDEGISASGLRGWELLEICQLIPIKLISQFSHPSNDTMPRSSQSRSFTQKPGQQGTSSDLPASMFPRSTDYGMIYHFEHVESKQGSFPATEGFLYLLSTLVKVAGCPSALGDNWRLRPGCAPYIEYAADFILPRATGMVKNVGKLSFAGIADECRLVERALEVVEAVLVRYVVPPVQGNINFDEAKEWHKSNIKRAKAEMGLAPVLSDIYGSVENIDEREMNDALQDFRNINVPPQEVGQSSNTNRSQPMLETSLGSPVPLPKTPGFAILTNLLSTSGSLLFQIIQKLLSENGGSRGIHDYSEKINSRSLATCLFRETPPHAECANESLVSKDQRERNLIDEKAYESTISKLRQSIIQPLNPLLLQTYFERSYQDACGMNVQVASSDDAILWRERTLLLSLRILCAAAAREEPFLQSLKQAEASLKGVPLCVVPTLLFKGPIHGSNAHRFAQKDLVSVSRVSRLLTTASSSSGRFSSPDILPIITQYIGYSALALPSYQGIARGSFSIVSYICHTLPHADATHALCGDDVNGIGLAHAFSKGIAMRSSDDEVDAESGDTDLLAAILDLILANIQLDSTANLNLSLMMLGLSGSSKHNCLNVILDLISDTGFVLDPKTSSSATKCFELIYRVCQLGDDAQSGLPHNVRAQQLHLMEKLRRRNHWHNQVMRYLAIGPSTPSIFQEVAESYRSESGDDLEIARANNDILHSISWLLKGLAVELHLLAGLSHGKSSMFGKQNQMESLLYLLLSPQNSLLLTTLIDMPLAHSKNQFISEQLHVGAPPGDVLASSSMPMQGPVEVSGGYVTIDVDHMLRYFHVGGSQPADIDRVKGWAEAWNSFVSRVCACSHISQAWSDVVRIAMIYSPIESDHQQAGFHMNTRIVMDILSVILDRLQSPSHLDALGQSGIFLGAEQRPAPSAETIESECAMPLSIAALGLTQILIQSSHAGVASNDVPGLASTIDIAEEDVFRVCTLIMGAISSCAEDSSNSDERAAILSCAMTDLLAFSEEAGFNIITQNAPQMVLDIYVNASSAVLFNFAAAPVYRDQGMYLNAHEEKRGMVARAARSGLSALFSHLTAVDDPVGVVLCSRMFALDDTARAISILVQLINSNDNDVAQFLQQVAMFRDGVQLLARSGITKALLSFANTISTEEQAWLDSNVGANGTQQLQPPAVLSGHISLLNALLTSPLSSSDRVALAVDCFEILKLYCNILDRQVKSYPSNIELTMKFIEALILTYGSLKDEQTPVVVDSQLETLERSVLCIAYQLSAFPFPSHLLPPLPMELINVEDVHTSQMKNIAIDSGNQSTWWNAIADEGLPLPRPPTGSLDVVARHGFTSYQHGKDSKWSAGKYEYALSSSRCLETSIMFLIGRVHYVALRAIPTVSCIDAVAISKGICRCSDASRVSSIYRHLELLCSSHSTNKLLVLKNRPFKIG